MRVAQSIELTESENKILTMWSRGRRTAVRVMKRAKIILMAAKGEQNKTIAERLGMDCGQVARWRRRFVEKRVAGIEKDLGRGGRKATQREQIAPVIIERTTQTKPPNATHWSVRTLADTLGVTNRWCNGCGTTAVLNLTCTRPSKSAGTNGLLKKSSMWWVCILTLPNTRWCCRR